MAKEPEEWRKEAAADELLAEEEKAEKAQKKKEAARKHQCRYCERERAKNPKQPKRSLNNVSV